MSRGLAMVHGGASGAWTPGASIAGAAVMLNVLAAGEARAQTASPATERPAVGSTAADSEPLDPTRDVVAGAGLGGFVVSLSWDDPSVRYESVQGGISIRGATSMFIGPVTMHFDAGIAFAPAFECPGADDEDGCGITGEIFLGGLVGPAYAVADRTRVFARAGLWGEMLGRDPYVVHLAEAPRAELGFATWNPATSLWPAAAWKGTGITFLEAALSLSYLVEGQIGDSVDITRDGFAIGVTSLAVLGPVSLEAKLDASPGPHPVTVGTCRLCVGMFGVACVAAESVAAFTEDANDGEEMTFTGQTVLFTVGAGGVLGYEW